MKITTMDTTPFKGWYPRAFDSSKISFLTPTLGGQKYMAGSSMSYSEVTTQKVTTEKFILNGTETGAIATENTETANPSDLAAVSYVAKEVFDIKALLKKIDPTGTFLQEFNLISSSLIDPYLKDPEDWQLTGWYLQNHFLIYRHTSTANRAMIRKECYSGNGSYLVAIDIAEMPSGHVSVYVNETEVAKLETVGMHYVEITLNDITTDEFYISAVNVDTGNHILISYFTFYYISVRFKEYIEKKFRELAPVDMSKYVTNVTFHENQLALAEQLNTVRSDFANVMAQHEAAENPHHVTPSVIGAAPVDHQHPDLLSNDKLNDVTRDLLADYALRDHTHPENATIGDMQVAVVNEFQRRFEEIVGMSTLTVTKAPEGYLPSRYVQTEITEPLAILLSSTIAHTPDSSYDWWFGDITTSRAELKTEAPKVFDVSGDGGLIPGTMNPSETPITFRITFHSPRKVKGYTISSSVHVYLKEWSVFAGNTTFLHKINGPELTYRDNVNIADIYFEEPTDAESLSFVITDMRYRLYDNWKLKISIMYDDFAVDSNDLPMTNQSFEVCLPINGVNRLVTVPEQAELRKITVPTLVNDLPYYVFIKKALADSAATFETSFIPPEYGTTRKGINVFLDKFSNIERNSEFQHEVFTHPAFGELSLRGCASAEGYKLTDIYSSNFTGWKSAEGVVKATIVHKFNTSNVVLMGYLLSWRNEEVDTIPDNWTLTIEGRTAEGRYVTHVYDSVGKFYPFYSVQDDDIVYHHKAPLLVHLDTIKLTIETSKPNAQMSLNKFHLFLSERYFSIPENTMYKGINPSPEMCLGYSVRDDRRGFIPVNLCLGSSCVLPVNNLELTESFSQYEVANPFFTPNVNVAIQNYALEDSSNTPDAYITEVSADRIVISTNSSFRYAVSISRVW